MEQVQVYVVGTVRSRHTFFVVFPELGSPPAWTQESLEALNARDIEYNGCRYTRYEISQMQRARERAVRKWKRRYLAEDAAGADTAASAGRPGRSWPPSPGPPAAEWTAPGQACMGSGGARAARPATRPGNRSGSMLQILSCSKCGKLVQ